MAEIFRKVSVILAVVSALLMFFGGGGYVLGIISAFAIYSFGWWAILFAVLTVISVFLHFIGRLFENL